MEKKIEGKRWVGWAAIFAVLIGLAAAALLWKYKPRGPEVQITPEVKVRLAGVLHQHNSNFSAKSVFRVMYEKLPEGVQSLIPSRLVPAMGYWQDIQISSGSVKPVFLVEYPQRWRSETAADIKRRLTHILAQGRSEVGVRLNYSNGWYSETMPLQVQVDGRTDSARNRLADYAAVSRGMVFNGPWNQKNLEFEFVDHGPGKPEVLYSFKTKNPLYGTDKALNNSGHLPITVNHGSVAVTLKALVSRADVKKSKELLEEADGNISPEEIPAAEADTGIAPGTVAMFEVSDSGPREVTWQVKNLGASYGTIYSPFRTSTEELHPNVVVFLEDLGMLQQPVRLGVSLQKASGFDPDEEQVVEIALPPKRKTVEQKVPFWDTDVAVTVGNYATVGLRGEYVSASEFISIWIPGFAHRISDEHLLTTNGTTVPLEILPKTSTGTLGTNYRPSSDTPLSLSDDRPCSVVITLTKPKNFPHKFVFIAEPTAAAR